MPYAFRSDDVDLDRTLEVLTAKPDADHTDVIVRERSRTPEAVVLLVDVSGSMRGEKARIVAATVSALAADLVHDELGLVAFWSDAAVISSPGDRASGPEMLERMLRIPARGLTNLNFGLEVARSELARCAAPRRTVVLLSDAVHNAGPDPRDVARKIPRLHVLLQTDGEHDAPLAVDLARLGHGRLATVRTYRDVPEALNRAFAF
ncbi:VWA domain-containing protein [Nocardioides sp. NPDC057767]|uniref:vWA domain-containing protein n=1 Tax=unclassified Nocardioides TaxID=2615069 RepID=UPI0036714A82